MGIPAYFSHIIKEHRSVLKHISTDTFGNPTHLFLDSNSIIYDVVRSQAYSADDKTFELTCIKEVCKYIQHYIKIINPSKMTMIAFDGVAPVAKLKQQQTRRYKSAYMKENFPNSIEEWDTTVITPGTPFMKQLSAYVLKFFSNTTNVFVSTSDEFGEGEHKICEFIRTAIILPKNDKLIIYGLDADLIMLALQHLRICPEIYLFRETPHFIKSIDNTLNPNELYALDIPLLASKIIGEMKTVPATNAVSDYIFISFLLGNDFIPHMPALNIRTKGITHLFNAYTATISERTSLTENGKINWKSFKQFIQFLSENEHQYIKSEYETREKQERQVLRQFSKKSDKEKLDVKPQIERSVEHYINPKQAGWQWRYYKKLCDVDIQHFSPRKICINYLEALEWTLHYYTYNCKNVRWSYHYMYPPLLSDLVQFIPSFNTIFVDDNQQKISAEVQLAYVLPEKCSHILTIPMQHKMAPFYKKNKDPQVEWAFCKYFWESHIKLSYLSIDSLED